MQQFPTPETKKAVCSFLGLTDYYLRFVESYAAVAVALTNLTKKNSPHKVVIDRGMRASVHQTQGVALLSTYTNDLGL